MIISASRRTDIPALYGEWFENRLAEGFVLVRHPRNYNRYTKVSLKSADCAVFWTKNPIPFLPAAGRIEKKLPCAFQFTLNAYGASVEPGLPGADERAEAFEALSALLGRSRVVWRYDPVLFSERHGPEFHMAAFEGLCKRLEGLTERCVVSFLDVYGFLSKRLAGAGLSPPGEGEARALAAFFAETAARHGITVTACAEPFDFSAQGVKAAGCIDSALVKAACGKTVTGKDAGQRGLCACVPSVDIGGYDTCDNGCAYCYATASRARAAMARASHDAAAPCISGHPPGEAEIFERE